MRIMMQKNDVIVLDLILKDNNTKEVLDTTFEKIAKENNLNPKAIYKPLVKIFGTGDLLPSIEENIKNLKEGDTKTFSLTKDNAFGDRDPQNTRILPISEFKKENITPEVGMQINLGDQSGKIISISGGRVKIDLNPPFAGRDLEYTVTINKIYTQDKDKIQCFLDTYFSSLPKDTITFNLKDKELEIMCTNDLFSRLSDFKHFFSHLVFDVTNVDVIKYSEIYKKSEHNHSLGEENYD
jgi:FKBP-type peptidyl-prolyl cis-trans isomerase 2